MKPYPEIDALLEQQRWIEALSALDPYLEKDPDDPAALFYLGIVLLETQKPSLAYHMFRRVCELKPNLAEAWCNYGKACGDLNKFDLEERYFKKALKLSPNNPTVMVNLSASGMHMKDPDKTIHWAKKALKAIDDPDAHNNLGFALLQKGDFANGWKEYAVGMGRHISREIRDYGGLPKWEGEPGQDVIVYGEQGLGDQIALATCVPDAMRDARIVLDVHKKLPGLFRRSFGIETHGDCRNPNTPWANADARISLSELNALYRTDKSKFSGKRFLAADPSRRIQWNALLKALGDKPKIGIAWTGGLFHTQRDARSFKLEEWLPILTAIDATWISLEYKDDTKERMALEIEHGIKIHSFPWATQTEDYDDTAALVAELDLVIAVPTSVVHLAGGLGTECWCLVQERPSWWFGLTGNRMPFYGSVELYRRNEDGFNRIVEGLHEFGCDYPGGSGTRADLPTSGGISEDSHLMQGAIQ